MCVLYFFKKKRRAFRIISRILRGSVKQPRVILLDLGMTSQLDPEESTNLMNLFNGLGHQDGEKVADSILSLSPQSPTQLMHSFQSGIDKVFQDFKLAKKNKTGQKSR